MSINKYSIVNKEKTNKSFLIELSFFAFVFCFLFIFGSKFLANSIETNVSEKLQFQETGNVKYSVCLKSNNFFDDECLDSNMTYVASLIKSIPLTFNYQLNSNLANTISSVDYEIVAKLVMENDETKAKYYNKEFVLVPKTTENTTNNGTLYNLKKMVDIDYEYYNSIATNFKSQYGVDSQSYLEVYLNTYNNVISDNQEIPKFAQVLVQIPLSKKAIEIKFNTQEINKNIDKLITSKSLVIKEHFEFIIGIIFMMLSIVFLLLMLITIRKRTKKTSYYDECINKILKEYDRLIVETSTYPKENDYNILIINSFNELIDVRDNLRSPIMFYRTDDNKKAKFYILNDGNLYLYVVSAKKINDGEKKK